MRRVALFACAIAIGCGSSRQTPTLPSPSNLRGELFKAAATLFWNPVPNAKGYTLKVAYVDNNAERQNQVSQSFSLEASATSASVSWEQSRISGIRMSVAAMFASGPGPSSDVLEFPDAVPLVQAAFAEDGTVTVHWVLYGTQGSVDLFRAKGDGVAVAIALRQSGSSYVDAAAEPDTGYSYFVRQPVGDVSAIGEAQMRTLLAAPRLTARSDPNGVRLDVASVAGASGYSVGQARTAGGSYSWGWVDSWPTVEACGFGETCYFVVVGVAASGTRGLQSAEVAGSRGPERPYRPSARLRTGAVALEWSGAANAAKYEVLRAVPPLAPSVIGSTTGTSFLDTTGVPYVRYTYSIAAVSEDGYSREVSDGREAFSTTSPDQVNLASWLPNGSVSEPATQTFTVGKGGQLVGVELPRDVNLVGVRRGGLLVAPATRIFTNLVDESSPLESDRLRADYWDLSAAALFVSEGEELTLDLDRRMTPLTGDGYARGSRFVLGIADPAHDVPFKTFVDPSVAAAEMQVDGIPGDRSIVLIWNGVPGARGYDLLERLDDASLSMVATTLNATAVAPGLTPGSEHTYIVRALLSGAVHDSAPATFKAGDALVDQQNGGGDRLSNPGAGPTVDQSFTCGVTGILAGVEFMTDGSAERAGTFSLLDEAGTELGEGTAAPMDALRSIAVFTLPVRSGLFVDFSALRVSVSPGRKLTVRYTGYATSYFYDTSDAYVGGTESVNGEVLARDLVFRTWVRP